jgi:uncharacterized protein YwqG
MSTHGGEVQAERQRVQDILEAPLGRGRAAAIVALGRPAIAVGQGVSDEIVGRLGGTPRLAGGVDWPTWQGRPLSFLAELDLAAISAFDSGLNLPTEGMLSFFVDYEEQPWGFQAEDFGGWRVIHGSAADPRRTAPDGAESFIEIELSGRQTFTLPDRWEDIAVAWWPGKPAGSSISPMPEELHDPLEAYCEAIDGPGWPDATNHRVGGWPSLVQNPFWQDCRLRSGGTDWSLLFQIDSDEDAGWMWGDVGMLYFAVRESDLRQQRFDDAWMVLQCT